MKHRDKEMGRSTLGIGALSERSGVNIETIRYYERIGIMPEPPRTAGGQRVYDAGHLGRLVFIRRSRELGFSLDEIRTLLHLADGGDYSCGQVHEMTLAHIADIRRKIADLRRMERVLREMAANCAGGEMPECPILEALSA
ncbi:MerR family transcriptional regulator, mercuric resistance operon regulatory protein [Tistlia consotensis]|uniref:MerR family transcriptional regulator, mercuric resistance operon regulatory protein n=1 Tax=Tistlia consotensis USBA 355 TaxID=560819 RepID=A0A1Y6BYB7_9PROT|nr:helix-turn-helix domain-containing protein [Tistlia consotensis]SMF26495.1 MerR family transcriptional regulator, mercuric resistance operon regulatory protein [Tistlia consotensis USBA 355]SNR67094.1 MerR family transcriptional regulator, mercuric resistance operon regulatory protein [Tistlia consotensis]